MRNLILAAAAAISLAACATAPSPVTNEYRASYAIDSITVGLSDPEGVPDRYDASVMRVLEESEALAPSDKEQFREFAAERGGVTEDNAGERLLEYLIAVRLGESLPRHFSGDRRAALAVEVMDTTFPNAATMMLVGEVIGAQYGFVLSDAASDEALVQTNKPIFPMVQRSAGAGGGLLGIALRSGENRHLSDLQNIADGISQDIIAFLSGAEISQVNAAKLDVHSLPEGAEEEEPELHPAGADQAAPVAD